MIGNDLVYFPEWPKRKGERLHRFRQKIYTQEEIGRIEKSQNPHYTEALFWSAKEAAYKSWFKKEKIRKFRPTEIRIISAKREISEIKILLKIENYLIKCVSSYSSDFIHSISTPLNDQVQNRIHYRTKNVRPTRFLFQGSLLEIKKDADCIPHGQWKEQELDLSLSHDGGMYACVWQSGF